MEKPEQTRIEYDVDDNPVYVGTAPIGYESSEGVDNNAGWTIKKITWSSGNATLVQIARGKWDNRATLTYA